MDYPRELGAARQEIPSRLSLSLFPSLVLSSSSLSTIVPQHDYAEKRCDFLRYSVHAEKECSCMRACECNRVKFTRLTWGYCSRAHESPPFSFSSNKWISFPELLHGYSIWAIVHSRCDYIRLLRRDISRMDIKEFDSRLGKPEVNLHWTPISRYLFQSGRWPIEASV